MQLAEGLNHDGADGPPAVRQYWDAGGKQLVTNATGIWQRDLGAGNQFSGPVVGGHPLGVWQLNPAKTGTLAKWTITETYGPDGMVKAGVERDGAGMRTRYHGASRGSFLSGRTFEAAEAFQMPPPCRVAPPTPVLSGNGHK